MKIKTAKLPVVSSEYKTAQLVQLLQFVRKNSIYYQQLYQHVPIHSSNLQDFPVLSLEHFWQANSIEDNQVLTAMPDGGITFKSGGSTGNPKYSVFSNEDWDIFTKAFGLGLRRSGLIAGQPIGNLFYAGRLYASFLFISRSIEQAQVGMCYPIAGVESEEIISLWKQFGLTTLAGVPTTLMNLLAQLDDSTLQQLSLRYFLYGGEPMFADQVTQLQRKFPQCQVRSIGIAGVDYGELGWACPSGELGVHHCFDDTTLLEILDDEDQVISEPGIAGRLVLTNFKRRLMPVIRYPVGDQGMWIDPLETPWRRFKVLGRSHDGARIGPMTIYVDDILELIRHINASSTLPNISTFQIQVDHFDQKDGCTLRFVSDEPLMNTDEINKEICQRLYTERTMFKDLIEQSIVHPLQIEWIETHQLVTNLRTGKLLRVIDQRHQIK